MKKVIYGTQTLHDAWQTLNQFRPEDNGFTNLGSGSDYTAFLQLGIGALDFGFDANRSTPVYHYHSQYDSHHWMKTLIDPDFGIHAAAGQFMTLLAYRLVNDALVPFDMVTWARNINYYVRDFVAETMSVGGDDYGVIQRQIAVSELDDAAKKLMQVAYRFEDVTTSYDFLKNATRIEEVNGKMKKLGRLFVRDEGLPGRKFYKNVLVAPNREDGYKAQTLPGSVEALRDGDLARCREWNVWLTGAIEKASELLSLG